MIPFFNLLFVGVEHIFSYAMESVKKLKTIIIQIVYCIDCHKLYQDNFTDINSHTTSDTFLFLYWKSLYSLLKAIYFSTSPN